MYQVDLNKLADHSKMVVTSSFGRIDRDRADFLTKWLGEKIRQRENQASGVSRETKIRPERPVPLDLRRAVLKRSYLTATASEISRPQTPNPETNPLSEALEQVWQTEVLMLEGVEGFAADVAKAVLSCREDRPIYPIINSDWKSDAWLTGLVMKNIDPPDKLNPSAQGFGLLAKDPLEPPHDIPLDPETYDLLYVDDASYSGTQARNLLNSVFISTLRPKRLFLMLAAVSQKAHDHIGTSSLWRKTECKLVKEPGITKEMKTWYAGDILESLRAVYGTMNHIEVDPDTLHPQTTKGEFPIFEGNCLAIPPYKIPDSLSVPTHLYIGYNPATQSSIFEGGERHLFQNNGRANYRTVMGAAAEDYAKQM